MPMTSSCSEPNAPAADEDCGGLSTGIKPTKRLPAQRKGAHLGRRGDSSTRLEIADFLFTTPPRCGAAALSITTERERREHVVFSWFEGASCASERFK